MTDLAIHPDWETTIPDLRGTTVVVVGGSGGVGEGVVRTLLADGATVVATGRSLQRLGDLTARIAAESAAAASRLHTAVVDAAVATLDTDVARLARAHGPFDGVVVSVASWGDQRGIPALELTDAQWDEQLDANLTSVFRLFRAFYPHTRHGGVIAQLNGMSAQMPFPGAAGRALAGAATLSLTRTIDAEQRGAGPRFYQVILGMVRTRARQRDGIDDPRWLNGEEVGAHLAALVAGTSPLRDETVHFFVSKNAGPQQSAPQW